MTSKANCNCMRAWLLIILAIITHETLAQSNQGDSQTGSTITTPLAKQELLNLRGIKELTEDIGSGGFDVSLRTGIYHIPKLDACGSEVNAIGVEWGNSREMRIVKNELSADRTVLHLHTDDKNGFYELIYRADVQNGKASLSFSFFDPSGNSVSAALDSYLNTNELEDLHEKFVLAMTCKHSQ